MSTGIRYSLLLLLSVGLFACETPPPAPPVVEDEPPREPVQVVVDTGPSDEMRRTLILADMLYDARLAIEDNRLMTPAGNNAYDMLRSVLDIDPGNKVALQSMQDIVSRYVSLAMTAIRLRQFDRAATHLERASTINSDSQEIRDARTRLREAMNEQSETHFLDPDMLSDRQQHIVDELGLIGQAILDNEARFLITARTDEEGRWIYRKMSEAVGGERLRGDIAVGSRPGIRIILSDQSAIQTTGSQKPEDENQ